MGKYVFVILLLVCGTYSAFADTGPEVPKTNSTMQQYCWNGTCQTPNHIFNGTISINDTSHNELRTHYNIIMIIPSESCTNAFKYHVKTDCPPLQNLTKYDTSNQNISGYFYSKDGINLDRTNPQVKNHWMYYGYSNKTIICVYCTGNYLTTDLYDTIILQGPSFEYAPHTFVSIPYHIPQFNSTSGEFTDYTISVNEQDSGLTTFLNRSPLSPNDCNTVTIAYSDELLNDTIHYLESGCTITKYNQTNTHSVPNTPWQYDNPYSSLHYVKAVSSIFKGWKPGSNGTILSGIGPGNCINGCPYTTSTKKPGW